MGVEQLFPAGKQGSNGQESRADSALLTRR